MYNFADVLIRKASRTCDLHVFISNPRLNKEVMTMQDVVRALRVLQQHKCNLNLAVNSTLDEPMFLTFNGWSLQQAVGGTDDHSMGAQLDALKDFCNFFTVVAYFEDEPFQWILGPNLVVVDTYDPSDLPEQSSESEDPSGEMQGFRSTDLASD